MSDFNFKEVRPDGRGRSAEDIRWQLTEALRPTCRELHEQGIDPDIMAAQLKLFLDRQMSSKGINRGHPAFPGFQAMVDSVIEELCIGVPE